MTSPRSRANRDQASLDRRLEVLKLPVVPLHHHGVLVPPPHDPRWRRSPTSVGLGPHGVAAAVWPDRSDERSVLVSHHRLNGDVVASVEVHDPPPRLHFVQPMPDGAFLLASARSRGEANAGVWTADGTRIATAYVGDALRDVLTTDSGHVWVGYFDEAMGSHGPSRHGLARFRPDLDVDWTYPQGPQLPVIFDSYSLNVTGETAHTYAYTDFHIVRAEANTGRDLGVAPHIGARALLVDGSRAVLIGGYGAEYDLMTPLNITSDGISVAGEARRLVMPDGLELAQNRRFARGSTVHFEIRSQWYSTSIDDVWPV